MPLFLSSLVQLERVHRASRFQRENYKYGHSHWFIITFPFGDEQSCLKCSAHDERRHHNRTIILNIEWCSDWNGKPFMRNHNGISIVCKLCQFKWFNTSRELLMDSNLRNVFPCFRAASPFAMNLPLLMVHIGRGHFEILNSQRKVSTCFMFFQFFFTKVARGN